MKQWLVISAVLSVLLPVSASVASGLSCPPSVDGGVDASGKQQIHPFRYVSFFDGDPSELADLAPDDGPNPKVLEQRWQFTRVPGRPIVMVCRYHGTDETVRREVPVEVQQCRLTGLVNETGEVVGSPTLDCH